MLLLNGDSGQLEWALRTHGNIWSSPPEQMGEKWLVIKCENAQYLFYASSFDEYTPPTVK